MTVRRLTPEDAAAFRAIRLEALEGYPGAFTQSYADAERVDAATYAARLGAGPDAVFGAFEDGELIGTAAFSVRQGEKIAHKGLLWAVYVRPGTRSRGLGRALVSQVLEHAKQHVLMVQATVVSDNPVAGALYESLGFETYGVEKSSLFVEGRLIDDIHIVHWLGHRADAWPLAMAEQETA
jgi:ribosomal protein S18 acetylase RimI-like enzyme